MAVTGFVLAGGRSTRMGRDKALLDWHGRTLLEHATGLLQEVTDSVEVVGRDQLPDRVPKSGPLSGIVTALEATLTEVNLVIAVDLPYLTKHFLKYLRARAETSHCALVACNIEADYPLCLGMRKSLLPEVRRRLADGQLSVRGLIESASADFVTTTDLAQNGFDSNLFRNINTPEDYESLR
jgi:molybdopterin-guanine dinucleotide biosynthesis protein A